MKDQKEKSRTIPFTMHQKNKQTNLGINLPKKAKDQYSENFKMLMKETEDDTDGKIYWFLDWKNQYC